MCADTVDEYGFFCCTSKRDSEGWQAKRAWLEPRFAEGLKLYLLPKPLRGFVEFIPGEHAWRPIDAEGWMVIHCLWVVGKSKDQGAAKALLDRVVADARAAGARGVAAVASKHSFLTSPEFYEHHGFVVADHSPPAYDLVALPFGDDPLPRFTARAGGAAGLWVQSTDQCPYHAQLVDELIETGRELGHRVTVEPLTSAAAIRARAVSGHGSFGLTLDGEPLPNVFLGKDLRKALRAIDEAG